MSICQYVGVCMRCTLFDRNFTQQFRRNASITFVFPLDIDSTITFSAHVGWDQVHRHTY